MKASDLLVDCLEIEGVDYVFGIPGEELEDLLFSLHDSDITFVPVRHEQGAAFMADVHGRLTGEAGVCLSTLGPGATNLMTGVADAHLDKSPLVAITGQSSREDLHKESHQTLDIVHMFEPITKWNAEIREAGTVPESVRKAFKLSEFEKPGTTHIELPEDVAAVETEAEPLTARDVIKRPSPDPDTVRSVADLLEEADRPLVLAGNGTVRTRASEQLRRFVSEANLPVVSTYMAKGAVSDASDHSLMTLESGERVEEVVREADLVLGVGYDIAEHDPEAWNSDLGKTIVHVDFAPAEVYEHYNPDVELVSDIPGALRALTDAMSVEHDADWFRDACRSVTEALTEKPDSGRFTVEGVLPYLREAMDDGDVLVSDVGNHKMEIARKFPVYEPNTCIVSNGLASMGIGVPGGLAADLAVDSEVVVGTGDGGFLMNAAELETASRLDCSYTVVVFTDDDYGLISDQQEESRGDHVGTGLTNPDLVAFAESFGIEGHRPADWDELATVLDDCVGSDELSLVDVPLA